MVRNCFYEVFAIAEADGRFSTAMSAKGGRSSATVKLLACGAET
jgi:hypothetical protein